MSDARLEVASDRAQPPSLDVTGAVDDLAAQSLLQAIIAWGLVVAAAMALGVYADLGETISGPIGLVPQLAAPWVLLAFAAGSLCRRWWVGVACGVAVILGALATYLTWKGIAYGAASNRVVIRDMPLFWACMSFGVGTLAGAAGSVARSRNGRTASLGWGALVGMLGAEALILNRWLLTGSDAAILQGCERVAVLTLLAGVYIRYRTAPLLLAALSATAFGTATAWIVFGGGGLAAHLTP